MSNGVSSNGESLEHGRSIVFRNATVVTMDKGHRVIPHCDLVVINGRIADIGPHLAAPADALVIDAAGGILMPGMVDTHRHMWQTAMRAYGADWTLTQYFVWYYLQHGKEFRPQDIYAGNILSALEAVEAGVTTAVDWSHGLQTTDHADAAVDALEAVNGRFVLAYGNIQQAPWEWSTSAAFRDFVDRRFNGQNDLLSLQLAFDVVGDPEFQAKAAFDVARDLGVKVTTHAGVWGVNGDPSVQLMYDAGVMTDQVIYVHAASLSADSYHRIAATGGSASVSTESEMSCGQGYPSSWELRKYDIPISLSMDTSVWQSADLFTAMRTTLGADRARQHHEAHLKEETITNIDVRCEEVIEWGTMGGARALGMDSEIGSLEVGKQADVVLIKNDHSPVMFPIVNPYGHIVMQAQRGDVHTVLVKGNVVKHEHRLVGVDLASVRRACDETVEYLSSTIGSDAWISGMNPELSDREKTANPYKYMAD